MSYLVFPRVRVQTANMIGASFLIGGPPLFAAYGLGEALCHHLGGGARVRGVALVHHDREALGQSFYGVFSPQQRRAAAFTFSKSANGSDYSSKNAHALSLQPVACAHLRVSLIWELENLYDPGEAEDFLHQSRLAGGQVVGHGKVVAAEKLLHALEQIGGGYVVMDRRDMLESKESHQADLLIRGLGRTPSADKDASWLSAACVGYAAITPFERRGGARGGYAHAFAEPLVGMVQYRSLRECRAAGNLERLLWRPVWLEGQKGAFVLRQEETEVDDGM